MLRLVTFQRKLVGSGGKQLILTLVYFEGFKLGYHHSGVD